MCSFLVGVQRFLGFVSLTGEADPGVFCGIPDCLLFLALWSLLRGRASGDAVAGRRLESALGANSLDLVVGRYFTQRLLTCFAGISSSVVGWWS